MSTNLHCYKCGENRPRSEFTETYHRNVGAGRSGNNPGMWCEECRNEHGKKIQDAKTRNAEAGSSVVDFGLDWLIQRQKFIDLKPLWDATRLKCESDLSAAVEVSKALSENAKQNQIVLSSKNVFDFINSKKWRKDVIAPPIPGPRDRSLSENLRFQAMEQEVRTLKTTVERLEATIHVLCGELGVDPKKLMEERKAEREKLGLAG